MRIILATGIYPPQIGGTATYAYELFGALKAQGHDVKVVTYGAGNGDVIGVSKSGGMIVRWKRYAKALREHAKDADTMIAFSSVSVGIPFIFAKLSKPKKVLRLGGEFFWERYTDAGGRKSLKEWYASRFGFWRIINTMFMGKILRSFDAIVYSTAMQREIHQKYFSSLPPTSVVENAVPSDSPTLHMFHEPMRLLCMSRFVGFKNLDALIEAMKDLPTMRLTMMGDGPLKEDLKKKAVACGVSDRIAWESPVSSTKGKIFGSHDILLIPSVTEISPNTALEARAAGLPVLLSEETGLSPILRSGMQTRPLRSPEDIASAILDLHSRYDSVAREAAVPPAARPWTTVADAWVALLSSL